MCACGTPTVNGQPGYRWQPTDRPSVRPIAAPELRDGDVLIFDEPGRCGGLDCHSHHFRFVRGRFGYKLLVRHGCGDETIDLLSMGKLIELPLQSLDSTGRYWMFHAIYSTQAHAATKAMSLEAAHWRKAAAEKRIKVRKVRGADAVRVTVEEPRHV